MYLTLDGKIVTHEQIKQAFEAGNARIVHGHRDASQGGSSVSSSLQLDGIDFDSRGNFESVWEESWTRKPGTLRECLRVAGK